MKHSFLDQYSDRNSLVHHLDPRTKLVATLVFIIGVLLVPPESWLAFTLYFIMMTALLIISRVPPVYIFRRSLIVLPFVLMMAIFIPFFKEGEVAGSYNVWLWRLTITHSGLQILINILIKSWLSVLSLVLLTSTTKMDHLLLAMERLKLPHVMVVILSFMYRYLFVLVDETMRLKQARDTRNLGRNRLLLQARTLGNMVGTLFIRSYERGERVYVAMLARGYDGEVRLMNQSKFTITDAGFGIGLCLAFISICATTLVLS